MDTYMGTIVAWAPNYAPQSWMYCQGQTLSISSNNALFAIIGTTYGGNGQTTFQLPNLAGRVPVGVGTGAGLSTYALGQVGGTEKVTLNISQLPSHTHAATVSGMVVNSITIQASSQDATDHAPSVTANSLAAPIYLGDGTTVAGFNNSAPDTALNVAASATISGTVTNALTGGNLPVPIVQPYLALNYIICVQGIFPPRN
ncbi:phage tail protein [Mucilaginibacter sp. L196]|uniref:phage tail protein n=1 Tax=Mucilaginibacter sp. L196 TaxID=1641870 RepID=UPI00131A7DC8|nr:tail fiber protein [Mucilaginibacter sp. L196]